MTFSRGFAAAAAAGDDKLIQINLPASVFPGGFPFYGKHYSTFWLSSNGWLSFVDPGGDSA